MLTLQDLQSSTINPAVAREAFVQTDRYLVDTLAVRNSYEQKAASIAGCFIAAIKAGKYAAVGSTPEMWLTPGVIDGDENAVPAMLAYLTYYHQERIEISIRSNRQKASLIDAGIILGALAPLTFLLLFLIL